MTLHLQRTIFSSILVIGIFALPWYATFVLSIIGLFLFDSFYEYIVVNVFIFAIYGSAGLGWFSDPLLYAGVVIGLFIGISELRRYLIIYSL